MPFALLLVLGLLGVDGLLRGSPASPARQVLAGVAMAAPLQCRSIGVVGDRCVPVAGLAPPPWHSDGPGRACSRRAAVGRVDVCQPRRGKCNPVLGYYTDYLGWWAEVAPWKAAGFLMRNAMNMTIERPAVLFGVDAFAWKGRVAGASAAFALGVLTWVGMAGLGGVSGCLPACLLAYLGAGPDLALAAVAVPGADRPGPRHADAGVGVYVAGPGRSRLGRRGSRPRPWSRRRSSAT